MTHPPPPPSGPPPGEPHGHPPGELHGHPPGRPSGPPPGQLPGHPPGPPSGPPAGPPPGPPAGGEGDPPFSDPVDRRARSAQAAFRVPFSVLDAFVAIAAYFVGQVVVGVALAVVLLARDTNPSELSAGTSLALALVAQMAGAGLAVGYLAVRQRLSWRMLGPVRPGVLTVALGLAVGIGGTVGAYTINLVLALLFDPEAPVEQRLLEELLAGGGATLLAIVIAVVLAPLVEEWLFRGLLFQSLRRRVGLWPAALLSALAFTVIHVEVIGSQPLALAGLFSLGVLFAWALHRTGSLLVPILAHATFNGISLALAVAIDRLDLDVVALLPTVAGWT